MILMNTKLIIFNIFIIYLNLYIYYLFELIYLLFRFILFYLKNSGVLNISINKLWEYHFILRVYMMIILKLLLMILMD